MAQGTFSKVLVRSFAGVLAFACLVCFVSWQPAPTVVTHYVASGDPLPMFDGDLETVTFEPWGACELTHWRRFTSDATGSTQPLPLDVPWTMTTRYRISVAIPWDAPESGGVVDNVITFADAVSSGVLTLDAAQAAEQTHILGPFTNPIAGGVQPTIIQDDARCNHFEGTGELSILGGYTNWASLYGAPGVEWDFPLEDTRFRFNDLGVRVTYTSK